MKKARIIVTQEWLKKQLNLPEEAVVREICWDVNSRDCFELFVYHWGKSTPEGSLPEIMSAPEM